MERAEMYIGLDPEKSREAFNQDILAYASLALASDPTLNSNVRHQKKLQEVIGLRSTREGHIFFPMLCLIVKQCLKHCFL
jgi:hypothetical protein